MLSKRYFSDTKKVEGVGVVKYKDLKADEIEVTHTLDGAGEGRDQGRGCR
jgi:hypothetical protein